MFQAWSSLLVLKSVSGVVLADYLALTSITWYLACSRLEIAKYWLSGRVILSCISSPLNLTDVVRDIHG